VSASGNGRALAEDATLAAIVRSSPDAVISKTVDGIVTSWNTAAERLYGYSAEQMIGRPIDVTFPPEHMAEEIERHTKVAAGEAESGFRCTRLCADGHAVDVVMSMTPVYDEIGQLITIASISRPVTEAERAQARYAALLEAAPDATVCVDSHGRIVTVNAQTGALFGYSPVELIGAEMEVLLPDAVHEIHRRHRAEFMQVPQRRSMGQGLSLSARRRDGSVFPVEVSLAPDTSGPEPAVIAAIRDVTAQRDVEAIAVENESRLRQVTESVDIVFGLLELNPFRYLYVSSGIKALTGRESEDLDLSRDLLGSVMIHPDDRERILAQRALVRNGQVVDGQYRIFDAAGRERWVRVVITPVPNQTGPVARSVIVIQDITERVQASEALQNAEAAARTANEAKNQFLSRMSHELRTPLNAVLGFGQLLQRRLEDTEYSEAIRHIVKGGRHLLDLINDVLDIARIESGDMSISTESVAVDEVVAETIDLMHPLGLDAGVTLHTLAGDSQVHVHADRQRLRQILLNLLSNAIKYNHTGGEVWVGWQRFEGLVAVTIRDNGQGIAPEHLDRLFTPFDRLGAEASGVEGTGIGLALTRALTEMMGGGITVESAVGRGSTFTLSLVTAPSENAQLSVVGAMEAGAAGDAVEAQATLLYIEDNAPNVRVVEELLKLRPKWKLIHAATGSLGIELAVSQRPDLILLDLHLPDLSGREVLTELKRRRELSDVDVIILTADAHAGLSRQFALAGAAGYLTKPFDIDDVLASLDSAFEAKGLIP
jgi:PAS domain S-box-containing protein